MSCDKIRILFWLNLDFLVFVRLSLTFLNNFTFSVLFEFILFFRTNLNRKYNVF